MNEKKLVELLALLLVQELKKIINETPNTSPLLEPIAKDKTIKNNKMKLMVKKWFVSKHLKILKLLFDTMSKHQPNLLNQIFFFQFYIFLLFQPLIVLYP